MKFSTSALGLAVGLAVAGLGDVVTAAWSKTANNNVVLYWGQNAYGNLNNDTETHQKPLLTYCRDTNVDIIPIGFLNVWKSTGDQPEVNFSNACTGWQKFPGTDLLWCPTISADIIACQALGKKILLSIGGHSPTYRGWATEQEAKAFATKVWNMFGKGWSYYRPFGEAVVDGFDLDFENAPATGYDHFAWQLRKHMTTDTAATGKEWLLTAAPQCPHPDALLDTAMRSVAFDAIFVQFYNNPSCQASRWQLGLDQSTSAGFNFRQWDTWAKTKSRNTAVKIFLTLPISSDGGAGYVNKDLAWKIIGDIKRYTNFGGFAGWDASFSDNNPGFLAHIKTALNKATIPQLPATLKMPTKRSHAMAHNHHRKH